MKLRMIINSILAVGALSLSPLALASPSLVISNHTDFPSTTIANGGSCSSELPPKGSGITPPQTTKEFEGKFVRAACIGHSEDCNAAVFLTDHCNMHDPNASVIANVNLSVNSGIKKINNISNSGYCLSGQGFVVTMDPNPSNQPCPE